MIEFKAVVTLTYGLTPEGEGIAKDGSHEWRLWNALEPKGGNVVTIPELEVR
jgi:hypothetical protein